MFVLVSYDIPDDRRRNRVAKALKDFGERVQYSVFECLLDAPEFRRMLDRVLAECDREEDSVRVYRLCESCKAVVEVHGVGKVTEDVEVFIV